MKSYNIDRKLKDREVIRSAIIKVCKNKHKKKGKPTKKYRQAQRRSYEMRAESATMPIAPYDITYHGDICEVRLIDNVTEIQGTEGEFNRWEYDEYVLTVKNRPGLIEDIENGLEAWITAARAAEYERLATEVRRERDELLKDSDWTQTVDAPLAEDKKAAWKEYRQALRDIPQQVGFPYDLEFPTTPQS